MTLVNGVEVRDVGSYTEWEGVVSSPTQVSSAVLRYGTDQNYPAGSTTRVYIPVSSSRENRLVDGLLVNHNEDGTQKAFTESNIIPAAALQSNAVTTVKILDANVTNAKLAANTAWTTWTPTYANMSVGNGTVVAKYQQIGKTVFFRYKLTLGSTSTIGTAPTISPPVTAASDAVGSFEVGTGICSVNADYWLSCELITTTTLRPLLQQANIGTYLTTRITLTSAIPDTWTTGHVLTLSGQYEAA